MERLYFILIIEVIMMILIASILSFIIQLQFSLKNEARISKYSINLKKKYSLPLFEKIAFKINKLIKGISTFLSKSEVIKKMSKRYVKYIDFNDKDKRKAVDFISIKLMVSFLIIILYIFSSVINLNFNVMWMLLLMIIGFYIPDLYFFIKFKNQSKKLEENLLESVIIMNNAFKSGKNILEAIELVKDELNGPLKDEYRKIYLDLSYGLDIEIVFDRFYERVKLSDIKYISSSLTLLNKTGGNIVKVFSSIEKNFYDKKVLNEELNSLTSSSKFMYKMLVSMPIILILVVFVLNKTYFDPLVKTSAGMFILFLSLILYIIYIILIKKVTRIKL